MDITDEAEVSEEADEAPADEDELLLLLLLLPNRLLQMLLNGGELDTEWDRDWSPFAMNSFRMVEEELEAVVFVDCQEERERKLS